MINHIVRRRKYLAKSWINPRIVIKTSPINGKGMFAMSCISKGETVLIWGGTVYTEVEIARGLAIDDSSVPIDENLYIATPVGDQKDTAIYTNHSCDANIGMQDEVTFVALRDIQAHEEITPDYSMWQNLLGWQSPWECNCGSGDCRNSVTGLDWTRRDLQAKYGVHFSPFINKRILEAT